MEISEVRVKMVANKDDRLKAFCSMTLDNDFVIRDIKIIEGTGGLFVLEVMEVRKRGLQGTSQRLLRTSPFLEISGCVLPSDVHQLRGSYLTLRPFNKKHFP